MRVLAAICLLSFALCQSAGQTVGNTNYVASAPAPSEDAASTTSSIVNLSQMARNGPSGFSVCTFNLQGSSSQSSSNTVTTQSISSSSFGSGLTKASISCSGPSNITLQGGPSLAQFAGSWKGVTYQENIQLPGSTMTFRGVQMVIEDSSFLGLQSFGNGALSFAASNITILNSTFVNNNNSAASCIYTNESSMVQVLDSNFTNNYGLSAGTVAAWNSSLIVNNTVFTNNTANSQGGALYVMNGSSIVILDSTFTKNSATNGGAVFIETCNNVALQNNIFLQNSATKSGGAVFQLQCPGAFLSNTFAKNSGANGAAVWHNNLAALNHTLNLFYGNVAINGSGGIELNQVSQMSISQCNFTQGMGVKGGAIYLQDVTGDITGSYFGMNAVTTNGGALFRGTSTGNLVNNVFMNNSANLDGGAVYDSHVAGDITGNTFSLPSSGSNIKGVFRTVCSGTISNNTGLPTTQISNQQPVAG